MDLETFMKLEAMNLGLLQANRVSLDRGRVQKDKNQLFESSPLHLSPDLKRASSEPNREDKAWMIQILNAKGGHCQVIQMCQDVAVLLIFEVNQGNE